MAPYYVEQRESLINPWLLWYGLLAPAIIWAVHLNLGFLMVGMDCRWALFPFTVLGLPGVRLALMALTTLAMAGVILAGIINFVNWRSVAGASGPERDPTGRYRFMVLAGFIMTGIFSLYLIWVWAHIILTEPC